MHFTKNKPVQENIGSMADVPAYFEQNVVDFSWAAVTRARSMASAHNIRSSFEIRCSCSYL
jgi:hypothetical protein